MFLTPSHATAFIRYHHHFTMSSIFFFFLFLCFSYYVFSYSLLIFFLFLSFIFLVIIRFLDTIPVSFSVFFILSLYCIYTLCLYQLKSFNYKTFILHVIYGSAIWAVSLTDRIKACSTIPAIHRCNGESRWFHVSSISPKCNVYTVSAPVDTAILLAVIYPPCPECHTQMTSLHMYILHCHSLHICHFYNILKVWI